MLIARSKVARIALVAVALGAASCSSDEKQADQPAAGSKPERTEAFGIETEYRAGDDCRGSGPEVATYFLQADRDRAWVDVGADGTVDALRIDRDVYVRNSVEPEIPWIVVRLGDPHLAAFAVFTQPGTVVGRPMFADEVVDPLADAQRLADSGESSPRPLAPEAPEMATVSWTTDSEGRVTTSTIESDASEAGLAIRSTVTIAPAEKVTAPSRPTEAKDILDLPAATYAPTSTLVDPTCTGAGTEGQDCIREQAGGATVREWLERRRSTDAFDGSGC